ncbi:hypothetical protein ONE63_005076 [Megalurothrips usitatus]|uniref:DNA (cytosine-5-)-methyltransferase n=1 Tax=Megalurothrips usitatus TaxID=439358 RepID=A0AAV7X768_9NEOP|nr:hypothetical protein ONE63_005076 [Megalurothrips usitatus]
MKVYKLSFWPALLWHIYHCFDLQVLPFPRKPIRVLSLFDGLASGLVVLSNNLRLKLSAYFSSEIDGDAITVQRRRHCGKIIGLGDVRKLTSEVLDSLGDISLLIGGSPCDNLSLVNPLRAGLADESASGSLFFNFVVIRDYLMDKAMRNRRPFYWLFENTAKLEVSTQEAMTAALGCSPVMCCSSSYLPARRQRLFWGNTPYINEVAEEMRRRVRTTSMQDIIGPDRLPSLEIFPTITTNGSAKVCVQTGKITAVYANGRADTLEISDYERLLGFTQSYTDVGRLSFSRRLRLLGKSWCIDVVTELLRPLVDLFECDISN